MSSMDRKKRRKNDDDAYSEGHHIEGNITDGSHGDGDEDNHASVRKKQRKQEHEQEHVDNKKKSCIKKPVPHRARALNDTLRDFQSNFGISNPSSKGIGPSTARSTPSILKQKQHGFKSSFGDDSTAADTPTRATATTRPTTSYHTDRVAQGATKTPLKHPNPPSKDGTSLLRPPAIHKKLLDGEHTTNPATPSSIDKDKGRANDLEEPSSEDADSHTITLTDDVSEAPPQNTRNRQHQGVTSLLHLSAKKQYKIPSTPSKPSPLSEQHNPHETPLGDIKPLKSLALISGLNTYSSNKPSSITSQDIREGTTTEDVADMKPKWAQLLETSGNAKKKDNNTSMLNQDITELLSPRKKRKGWVPTGFAENASGIIKRLQTGNNLWIHEISRTLSSYSKSSSSNHIVKKESVEGKRVVGRVPIKEATEGNKQTCQALLRDLNPHLRLEILEILSLKPASLTWSSQEGGFITAGAAEKLLITRCRIMKDEDTCLDFLSSQRQPEGGGGGQTAALWHEESQEEEQQYTPFSIANKEVESQIEGIVIFSLTAHSRTSTGITMVRKEQPRPTREATDDSNEVGGIASSSFHQQQNQDRLQPQLNFNKRFENDKKNSKKYNVYLPASIADLHTQMRINDEIWAWEPWSVVDLVDTIPTFGKGKMSVSHVQEEQSTTVEEKSSEKALLISRFAVLL